MLLLVALAAGAQKYIPMLDKENVWKIHTLTGPYRPYIYTYSIRHYTVTDTAYVPSEYTSEWKVRSLPKDDVLIFLNGGIEYYDNQYPYNFSAYDSVMVLDTTKEEVYKACTNPNHPKEYGLEDFRGAFILTEKDRKVYLSIQDNHDIYKVYNYLIYDFNTEEGDIITVANAAMFTDNINHSRESYLRFHSSDYAWNKYYDVFYTHDSDARNYKGPIDCILYRCWSPSNIPASGGYFDYMSPYDEKNVNLYCTKVEEHYIAGKNRRCLYFIRIDKWYDCYYIDRHNSYICWIEGIGSVAGVMFNVNSQANTIGYKTLPIFDTFPGSGGYSKCELVEFNGEPIQLDLVTGFKEDWWRVVTACGIEPALQGKEEKMEGFYDLSGRRLHEEPASGIYIRNGKKYIKR